MSNAARVVLPTWLEDRFLLPEWEGNESASDSLFPGPCRFERSRVGPCSCEVSDAARLPISDCLRSFRGNGLCAVDLSRGTARHRGMLGTEVATLLPHGYGPRCPPISWSPSPSSGSTCRCRSGKFCKSSVFLRWSKYLWKSFLRILIQATNMSIFLNSWRSSTHNWTAVGSIQTSMSSAG